MRVEWSAIHRTRDSGLRLALPRPRCGRSRATWARGPQSPENVRIAFADSRRTRPDGPGPLFFACVLRPSSLPLRVQFADRARPVSEPSGTTVDDHDHPGCSIPDFGFVCGVTSAAESVLPPARYSTTAASTPHLSPGFLAGPDLGGLIPRLGCTNAAGETAASQRGACACDPSGQQCAINRLPGPGAPREVLERRGTSRCGLSWV